MVLLYIGAGINHFISPEFYAAIVPDYLPWHLPIVYISGVAEFVLGILLIPKSTRNFAAWGIIILLILVFPANIKMMQDRIHANHQKAWIAILRLPIQIILIWWAWLYTKPEKKTNIQ